MKLRMPADGLVLEKSCNYQERSSANCHPIVKSFHKMYNLSNKPIHRAECERVSFHFLLICPPPHAACNRAKAGRSGTWRLPFEEPAHADETAGDADSLVAIWVSRIRSWYVLVVVMLVTQLFWTQSGSPMANWQGMITSRNRASEFGSSVPATRGASVIQQPGP